MIKMNRFGVQLLKTGATCLSNNRANFIALGRNCSAFTSDLSLTKLYPNSQFTYSVPLPNKNDGKFTGYIPMNELDVTYSRSSGPGGQNVNVVNTKVDLRFKVDSVTFLSEELKTKLREQHESKITKDGFFVVRSDVTRSQQMNLADALRKLRDIVWALQINKTAEVSEETLEKLRKRHEKATRMRLQMKRSRSMTKQNRQVPDY